MKINSIKKVVKSNLCNGCGACSYLFPENLRMINVAKYGMRPKYVEEDFNERIALDVCQGIHLKRPSSNSSGGDIANLTATWGNIIKIWKGYASDPYIRYRSSSGGIATALSLFCLEDLNYSGIFHIQMDADNPLINKVVVSKDRESVLRSAGSRYAPSSLCERLDLIHNSEGPVAFIGKPCDVAALHKITNYQPELKKKILLTISIFCAGAPSKEGTKLMLKQMGITDTDTVLSIRYRGNGWPGNAKVKYINRKGEINTKSLSYEYSWGHILQKTRPWRCRICPDHTGEFADISLGDLWNTEIVDEDDGQSIILVRTERGKRIIKEAIDSGVVTLTPVENDVLNISQPNLRQTRSTIWGRLLAMKLAGLHTPSFKRFNLFSSWFFDLNTKQKIKSILSTFKRIIVKNLWCGE